ncbi:unnamed protein product, partial [Owenia fusiformis]
PKSSTPADNRSASITPQQKPELAIFNLPESTSVNDLLTNGLGFKTDELQIGPARRVGSVRVGATRPRVTILPVKNNNDLHKILKQKRVLKNSAQFNSVYINVAKSPETLSQERLMRRMINQSVQSHVKSLQGNETQHVLNSAQQNTTTPSVIEIQSQQRPSPTPASLRMNASQEPKPNSRSKPNPKATQPNRKGASKKLPVNANNSQQ